MKNGGIDCNMNDDREILSVVSPKTGEYAIVGPYIVIKKDTTERWAIVALDFNNEPRLGIRWFTDNNGSPTSRSYPVWFLLPTNLYSIILDGLNLDKKFKEIITLFLDDKESKPSGSILALIGEIKNLLILNGYDESQAFTICYKHYDKIMKANTVKEREKEEKEFKEKIKKTENISKKSISLKDIDDIWK